MPKFLIEASYTTKGLRGLAQDKASGRKAAVEAALRGLGGKLESLHFAFGAADVYPGVRVSGQPQRGSPVLGSLGYRSCAYQDRAAVDRRGDGPRAQQED